MVRVLHKRMLLTLIAVKITKAAGTEKELNFYLFNAEVGLLGYRPAYIMEKNKENQEFIWCTPTVHNKYLFAGAVQGLCNKAFKTMKAMDMNCTHFI